MRMKCPNNSKEYYIRVYTHQLLAPTVPMEMKQMHQYQVNSVTIKDQDIIDIYVP